MYLPFDTSAAIAVGGLIKFVVERLVRDRTDEEKLLIEDRGSFLASGLIAGESIMGILLAITFLSGIGSFGQVSWYSALGGWLSLLIFAAIAYVLIAIPVKRT
jgi:hypothetical protein